MKSARKLVNTNILIYNSQYLEQTDNVKQNNQTNVKKVSDHMTYTNQIRRQVF